MHSTETIHSISAESYGAFVKCIGCAELPQTLHRWLKVGMKPNFICRATDSMAKPATASPEATAMATSELAAHAADRQLIVRCQVIHLSLTESQQFGNFARRQKFGFAHEALTREQRV